MKTMLVLLIVQFISFGLLSCNEKKVKEYVFHDTVTYGDDGHICFGDWPQSIKAEKVQVDETITLTRGLFTYYKGNDGNWYAKCTEHDVCKYLYKKNYHYSDGVTAIGEDGAVHELYFKVEPIEWYNIYLNDMGDMYEEFVPKSILITNIPFYISRKNRILSNDQTILPNDYQYSTLRAYLNGSYESNDTQKPVYKDIGFLQTAFAEKSQDLIESFKDMVKFSSSYEDKVFCFSDPCESHFSLIYKLTDFAVANGLYVGSNQEVWTRYLNKGSDDDYVKTVSISADEALGSYRYSKNYSGQNERVCPYDYTYYGDNEGEKDITNVCTIPVIRIKRSVLDELKTQKK